jgi:hypothetical protein
VPHKALLLQLLERRQRLSGNLHACASKIGHECVHALVKLATRVCIMRSCCGIWGPGPRC